MLAVGKRPKADVHTSLAAGGINAAVATMDPADTWQQHAADTLEESYLLADPRTVRIVTEGAARASRTSSATACLSPEKPTDASPSASSARTPSVAPRSPATHRTGDPTNAHQPSRGATHPRPRHRLHHQAARTQWRGLRCVRLRPRRRHPICDPRRCRRPRHRRPHPDLATARRVDQNTGDSFRLALDAGARIRDPELVQFHPSGPLEPRMLPAPSCPKRPAARAASSGTGSVSGSCSATTPSAWSCPPAIGLC